MREITLDPDKMHSYDVTSLFTCIPTQEVGKMVKKCLLQDSTLSSRTNFTPDHMCALQDPPSDNHLLPKWPTSTWNKLKTEPFLPSPELLQATARELILESKSAREVEVRAFTEHINAVYNNIKFKQEDVRVDNLPFLG